MPPSVRILIAWYAPTSIIRPGTTDDSAISILHPQPARCQSTAKRDRVRCRIDIHGRDSLSHIHILLILLILYMNMYGMYIRILVDVYEGGCCTSKRELNCLHCPPWHIGKGYQHARVSTRKTAAATHLKQSPAVYRSLAITCVLRCHADPSPLLPLPRRDVPLLSYECAAVSKERFCVSSPGLWLLLAFRARHAPFRTVQIRIAATGIA